MPIFLRLLTTFVAFTLILPIYAREIVEELIAQAPRISLAQAIGMVERETEGRVVHIFLANRT